MKNWLKVIVSQFVSVFGTKLCEFILLIWIFEKTKSSMLVSMFSLSLIVPKTIFSPFVAYLVDRLNRKTMLLVSEIGELFVCFCIIFLVKKNLLSVAIVLVINLLVGITEAFRFPAYSVITSSLLQEENYAKAHGMYMFVSSLPAIIAPIVGGNLYKLCSIEVFYMINILTLILSSCLICSVKLKNKILEENLKISLKDSIYSLKDSVLVLKRDKEILYILVICAAYMFVVNAIDVIMPLSILSKYENGATIYGNIETVYGVGGVIGALIITILGVGKDNKKSFQLAIWSSYVGMLTICCLRPWTCVVGIIILTIANQYMDACCQAWWQTSVPITKQGQVFAIRRFIIWMVGCLGTILAGLSDYILKILPKEYKELVYEVTLAGIVIMMFSITIFYILKLRNVE